MKKRTLLFGTLLATVLVFIYMNSYTQSGGVSISNSATPPDPSSMLDISSTSAGVLIPRMTESQRNAVLNPAEGLLIFNVTNKCFESFVNSLWSIVSCPSPCNNTGGTITGAQVVCQSQSNVQYNISINNGVSYMWSYTGSGVYISGSGNNVSIDFSAGATSGTLTVIGTNTCGSVNGVFSAALPITVNALPAAAGVVSGVSSVCAGAVSVGYSITPVQGANSYTWTVPSGAVITSGHGTTSINVDFASNSGDVVVTPVNSCGNGGSSSMYVHVYNGVPGTPGNISGNVSPSAGSTVNVYSISPVSNASSYLWTVSPAGATITSGQGTTSVSVDFPSGTASYSICVQAVNSCGNSPDKCLTITTVSGKQVFTYTGASQTFTVPAGTSSVYVKMWAAGGAGGINYSGGSGAFVGGILNVTPGSNLTVIVGGAGMRAVNSGTMAGGFGGGGACGSSSNPHSWYAGSGGGRSAIQIVPGTDYVTAGAGGGCGTGNNWGSSGGAGGAPDGSAGKDNSNGIQGGAGSGKGGTTTSGGGATNATSPAVNSVSGSYLTGSAGGGSAYGGGGGGGGYYGGSGGSGYTDMGGAIGGGGGGSSYTANLISPVNIAGNYGDTSSTVPAPNNTDLDYVSGVGIGGYYSGNGGNGLIVIYW